MAEVSMLRRTFRNCAVVAGLIERRHPGQEKTGRQVTFSSDLIYDVLRKHEPDHVLLRAARAEAAGGLTDIRRLADLLARVKGRISHRALSRVSPLAVPVLLEVGREQVAGSALDDLLDEAANELIDEAMPELNASAARRGCCRSDPFFAVDWTPPDSRWCAGTEREHLKVAVNLVLNGVGLVADLSGALVWPERQPAGGGGSAS